jgi:nicotinic acid mononucleotide adenylyltransferase
MARREILLYGTSANPVTGMQGHLGAISHCQSMGFDEIWILPVYKHIYSTKSGLAPFEHRVAMTQLAVAALPPTPPRPSGQGCVRVMELERELFEHLLQATDKSEELRIGSIDLIQYLVRRFPDASFTMLLGSDTYADLQNGKWKNGDELKRLVKFVVMSRRGYEGVATPADGQTESDGTQFVTIPTLSDISSTYVRTVQDADVLNTLVVPEVAAYIVQHKLYAFSE